MKKKKKFFIELGTTCRFKGNRYKVVKSYQLNDCQQCALKEIGCQSLVCKAHERPDKISIFFQQF